jgi:hypothetical protein
MANVAGFEHHELTFRMPTDAAACLRCRRLLTLDDRARAALAGTRRGRGRKGSSSKENLSVAPFLTAARRRQAARQGGRQPAC